MAYFHTTVLDEQIKALPTVDTASGSIATFDTDMTENLVEVKCQIVAQQSGSGTPSPSNPRPITVYTSLNLSHSGADTSNPTVYNIPFGQTVAQGVLNVGTGKLEITHYTDDLANLSWQTRYTGTTNKTLSANLTEYYKRNYSYFVAEQFERISGVAGVSALSNPDDKTVGMYDIDNSGYPTAQIIYIVLPVGDTPSGKIVYKLNAPLTVQLDSITLQALLNENNIWCDTGDTEVKFLLSVGKKIS